ncbi:T9SS type A sorting domain-containing protein [candidate division KSB1 bacterium]|nr:T9SS type A sorting domain-containing protein [candidate division KSB1 bacterium]
MRSFINNLGGSLLVLLLVCLISSGNAQAALTIDSNVNVGTAPLVVNFDLKGGWAYYQKWDFGDGTIAEALNPVHVYQTPGTYTVKVTYRTLGSEYKTQQTDFITVYNPVGLCRLAIAEACSTWPGESWDNVFDGDIFGIDGTASPLGNPSYAIFKFRDGRAKNVLKMRVLANPGINRFSQIVKKFRIQLSSTGMEPADFSTVWQGVTTDVGWVEQGISATEAKYIKFIIDEPPRSPQVGEIEIYSEFVIVDSLFSTISVTAPHVANGVEKATITLNLKDQYGAPVTGKTENDITFFVTGSDNNLKNFREIGTSGKYVAELTSVSPGEKFVSAFVNGISVRYIALNSNQRASTVFIYSEPKRGKFVIVDSSRTWPNEGWSNAFDGDIDDSDGYTNGTVSCAGNPPFVTVAFEDQSIHWISAMRLLTDTRRGWASMWVTRFHLEVSTTGLAAGDFSAVLSAKKSVGAWEEFPLEAAIPVKYIKFVVDEPASEWRQLGEIEFLEVAEPTPVELISFEATYLNDAVELTWATASESNNLGFEIERKAADTNFGRIGFVQGKGTTTEMQYYQFADATAEKDQTYYYRLKQIDTDGTFVYFSPVKLKVGAPIRYSLAQNYPNPFNPSTVIQYELPEEGFASLIVLNSLGQEIKRLVNENMQPGRYIANWDGTDFNGQDVAAGVYFFKIFAGDFVATKRMVLLR